MGRRKASDISGEAEILLFMCVQPETSYDNPWANKKEADIRVRKATDKLVALRHTQVTKKYSPPKMNRATIRQLPTFGFPWFMPESFIQHHFIGSNIYTTRDGVKKRIAKLRKLGFIQKVITYTGSGDVDKTYNVWKVKDDKRSYLKIYKFLKKQGRGEQFLDTNYAHSRSSHLLETLRRLLKDAHVEKNHSSKVMKLIDSVGLHTSPILRRIVLEQVSLKPMLTFAYKRYKLEPYDVFLLLNFSDKLGSLALHSKLLTDPSQSGVAELYEETDHSYKLLVKKGVFK